MKQVAVIGGGPAGAFAAERLAAAGLRTVILDENLAWEKPCGGGLTAKAYGQYPFLLENDTPKRLIHHAFLSAPEAGGARVKLAQPMLVYSRLDLNNLLLQRAEKAGAQVEQTRVLAVERSGSAWKLKTRNGVMIADYCIVATGARNPLRNVGTEWTPDDTMCALGYYIPSSQEHIDIQFLPRLEGYIWIFPRCGHLSAGICGRGFTSQQLRAQLEAFLNQKGICWKNGRFYAHVLPSLSPPHWRNNRLAGDGWLAVGDAGGLVDPVTGEGLYYALRSADLAGRIVLDDAHAPAGKAQAYRTLLHRDFGDELEYAATLGKRLYLGRYLFSSAPGWMVRLTRRSPRFHDVVADLFSGHQNYTSLRGRLLHNWNGTLRDVILNFFLNRFVPAEKQV